MSAEQTFESAQRELERHSARLRALSPKATLERGYSIVRTDNDIVRSASDVGSGDAIRVEVADGEFGARVE